ncbi:MAG: radical SAM protein, partial [Candidatus Methanofastidiosum sp.]|nr:radical SAM protein [Methanofastidiosum sp.]
MLNVYDIEEKSEIYGPGIRTVLWMQGCRLRCKGCWNKDMWNFKPHKLFRVEELVEKVKNIYGIEGITLIGGEPMHQSLELLKMAMEIKKLGLTVVLFTGYEFSELTSEHEIKLWKLSDIVICGRYEENRRNIYLQWRGSENQRVIFNTKVYEKYTLAEGNYCEINIDTNGEMTISGFP